MNLPATCGRLSWDQLAPLTRFATEENDEQLAREAPGWSANETKEAAERAAALDIRRMGRAQGDLRKMISQPQTI